MSCRRLTLASVRQKQSNARTKQLSNTIYPAGESMCVDKLWLLPLRCAQLALPLAILKLQQYVLNKPAAIRPSFKTSESHFNTFIELKSSATYTIFLLVGIFIFL